MSAKLDCASSISCAREFLDSAAQESLNRASLNRRVTLLGAKTKNRKWRWSRTSVRGSPLSPTLGDPFEAGVTAT